MSIPELIGEWLPKETLFTTEEDVINLGNEGDLNLSGSFTIHAWSLPNALVGQQRILTKHYSNRTIGLCHEASNTWHV